MPCGLTLASSLLLAMLCAPLARAQVDVGNGGDVVACRQSPDNNLKGYYSLDYLVTYEERTNPLVETTDARANLERIARVLQDKVPGLGESLLRYTRLIENANPARHRLWREANFGLVDLKDEYLVDTLPANCKTDGEVKVVQAAIRLTPAAAGVVPRTITYKYVPSVFRDLEKSAPLQLSFLLLHEWLWDISGNVQSNRNINRLLHSQDLTTLSAPELIGKLKSLGIDDKTLSSKTLPEGSDTALSKKSDQRTRSDTLIRRLDELHALWSRYKFAFIQDGRVVEHDESDITTSEGQGYAMLRAVWSADRDEFDRLWRWTRQNLQVRGDALFAWKWKGKVLDRNAASDADCDIALALSIAGTRFADSTYADEALKILDDIWKLEVVETTPSRTIKKSYFIVAGDWAKREKIRKIHLGYLAPYAYEEFARIDSLHPWERLIDSSYRILDWVYRDRGLVLPPEYIWLDAKNDRLSLAHPKSKQAAAFGYDAFPLFWRLATDLAWRGSNKVNRPVAEKALKFFADEWRLQQKFLDRYTPAGHALSANEGLPAYASVEALARSLDTTESVKLANDIENTKLKGLFDQAMNGSGAGQTPYYLHNWLWFGRALALDQVRTHAEFLNFLRPFNWQGFQESFPWVAVAILLVLYPFAKRYRRARLAILLVGYALCLRYLSFRLSSTLNLGTGPGIVVSCLLLAAECYSFISVVFLTVQVGLSGGCNERRSIDVALPAAPAPSPTVDILIPIYSEPLEILEATLVGATHIAYDAKKIHVCDDGHRIAVKELAEEFGANYIPGPKKHAKAGNINNAMAQTDGELVLIFDTDHIPVSSFLQETVPFFADARMGVVQTPHVFYNSDIFQRALGGNRFIGCEQDMFNQAIQSGRNNWGGSFFVGSGAIFRRSALQSVGGIQLLSITEDIHTSQKLHAAGWTSVFVDKNLAVGLAAENLASHFVQRRRWMLGCLQIMQKDNPLFEAKLSWRQKFGYFASLYYFLFPLIRVIYWATPLWFLFFHFYPVLSDVSQLLAYMLPAMASLVLMTQSLLPRWPRIFWNSLYESAISFPLARAAFDLFLPKRLGFKVTPKGIVSAKRQFDHATIKITLFCAAINLIAIVKGLGEVLYFGIEQDAYFFNLSWASVNLLIIGVGLLVAWERPQRRGAERVKGDWQITVEGVSGVATVNLSTTGALLSFKDKATIPDVVQIHFADDPTLVVDARRVYGRRHRAAFAFSPLALSERRRLLKLIFTNPRIWRDRHERRSKHSFVAMAAFLRGVAFALKPQRLVPILIAGILALALGGQVAVASPTEAWYLMTARTNMKIGNTKAAIDAFEKLVAIDPSQKEAQRSLGLAYELQGLTDKAVAQFDRYLERFKDSDPEIEFKQANYLLATRYEYRQDDAIKLFLRALDSESRYEERRKLAQLLSRRSTTTGQAVTQYDILIAERPDDQEMRAEYRKVLLRSPATRDKAIKEFEAYVADAPKDTPARRQLGLLLAERKDRADDADEILGEICRSSRKDRVVCLAHARILAADPARSKEALQEYKAILAQKRDFPVELEQADLLARHAGNAEAAAAYKSLVTKRPADAQLRVKYARVLARDQDNAREASVQFEKALQLAPRDVPIALDAHTGLAKTYAWTGDKDRALYQAQKATEMQALTRERASDMRELGAAMLRGREPRMTASALVRSHNDGDYFRTGVSYSRPINAFADGSVTIGHEFVKDKNADELGVFAGAHAEARWHNRFEVKANGAAFSTGADSNKNPFDIAFSGRIDLRQATSLELSIGAIRERRTDSVTAVLGRVDLFGPVGGVVDERVRLATQYRSIDINGRASYDIGHVTSQMAADDAPGHDNQTDRMTIDGSYLLKGWDNWTVAATGLFQNERYAVDCSDRVRTSDAQCADGYFSSRFFVALAAAAQIAYEVKEQTYAAATIGPRYESELMEDSNEESRQIDAAGFFATLSLHQQTPSGWTLGVDARYATSRRRGRDVPNYNALDTVALEVARIL